VKYKKSNSKRIGIQVLAMCLPLMATGCSTIDYPIWLGDQNVAEMCESDGRYSFTHGGITKQFEVNLVDPRGVSEACEKGPSQGLHRGDDILACIVNSEQIFVSPGNSCPSHMAHELSHGFGLHFVDRPPTHQG